MLEEAIPALWSTVHGWFTPAVLFLVLNLVIGTIAVTSKVTGASGRRDGGAEAGGEKRLLSRVPSMALERIRSFNLSSRLSAPAPEPPVTDFLDLGGSDEEPLPLQEEEEEVHGEIVQEHAHMERSMSEAATEEPLPQLPTRLRKSASEKSAFAHFIVEEETEVVEVRRPATTRDVAHRRPLVVEGEDPDSDDDTEESAGSGEVDARADDFINKFHHQLKLQRMDSFMRYKDTLRRGQAAAAAVAGTE